MKNVSNLKRYIVAFFHTTAVFPDLFKMDRQVGYWVGERRVSPFISPRSWSRCKPVKQDGVAGQTGDDLIFVTDGVP